MAGVVRYDSAPLTKARRSPQGGLRVDARLTKTGVFHYRQPDGSIRKEYRPEEEVFSDATLDSFKGIPVTIGHHGLVRSDNWRDVSVGHVGDDVRREAAEQPYVIGTVHVQHLDSVKSVEGGGLHDVSCGYTVDLDETPGEHRGERYDAVQRNIRGNHLALGPQGWGRAGKDCALRLDGNEEPPILRVDNMSDPKIESNPELDQLRQDIADFRKKNDELSAQNEVLSASLAQTRRVNTERLDSFVSERIALVDAAREVCPDFDFRGKTGRQIKAAVVAKRAPDVKLDGKSDDFIDAAFEMALKVVPLEKSEPHSSLGKLHQDARTATTVGSPIADSYAKNSQASRDAWKTKGNRDKILGVR